MSFLSSIAIWREDDREMLERMAKAWVHLALADEDVARETLYEPKGRLQS
jgi:hypothetical protein